MIGLESLAVKAAALEAAAYKEEETFIQDAHPAAMEQYRQTAETIRRAIGGAEDPSGPEEDVIEFAPEENG